MTSNPPPLVSPVPGLEVRAVLDQDGLLTAGLGRNSAGQRVVLLVSAAATRPGEREEFTVWGSALTDIGAVARISAIADYGHTGDGRPYLATYVHPSLSDRLRLVGPPPARVIRGLAATVADALAAAHSYGLIHAAVSPATVMMVDDGVRLGGFGATAPGLTGPLGVWAFTAPEHRAAAAAGEIVASPAADVFGLAATVCVALAGVLPWSDPTSWADEADLPAGPDTPVWVWALRAALSPDPDQRPTAEEFAEAMRVPGDPPTGADPLTGEEKSTRVDLRGLIPRQVRRLAAYSIDAMADGTAAAEGRAVPKPAVVPAQATGPARAYGKPPPKPGAPAAEPEPRRLGSRLRRHRTAAGVVATATAALVAMGVYAWAGHGPSAAAVSSRPSVSVGSPDPIATLELLNGARTAGQAFIHDVGVRSDVACVNVHGDKVILTPGTDAPISCADLIAHAQQLLGQPALDAMARALVVQAVGYSDGSAADPNQSDDPDPHAFISLPYVPALTAVLRRFEMVLTYRDSQWWVVEVTFG